MRRVLAIIRKDVALSFSGWTDWLFFLVLPIAFTFILAGGTASAADTRVRLVVVDQAHTPLSAELISALERSEAVRPELLALDRAEELLARRQVSAVLVIPAGTDWERLEAGQVELELRQQPNNLNALAAARAVRAAGGQIESALGIAVRSVAEAERLQPFASAAERQAYFDISLQAAQAGLSEAPERVAVSEGVSKGEIDYDPRASSSAGQLITWVFIPLIGISALFALERQRGTLRRLLTTPTRKATYLLGTIVGQVAIALVQMVILIGFGMLVLGVEWGSSPAALALMLVASALAAAALGTALGTLVRTGAQANGLSIMLGMVMALLGGCWYPIELFPPFVRSAVRILPTNWAMQGMLDIALRRQGVAGVTTEAGVLLGFAALFFAVGIWRFRYE